jgi:hypothetical protein
MRHGTRCDYDSVYELIMWLRIEQYCKLETCQEWTCKEKSGAKSYGFQLMGAPNMKGPWKNHLFEIDLI